MPPSESQVISELTAGGRSIQDFLLIDRLVCSIGSDGGLAAMAIDDPEMAAAIETYLRRIGARVFESFEEFKVWRPDWSSTVRLDRG